MNIDEQKREYEYDVALSFAGENRAYVKTIAEKLSANGLEVYFADWDMVNLLGRNLTREFANVYNRKSAYVIPFFSKEYVRKEWTRFEFEQMQQRFMKEEAYILPIVLDGTVPDEFPATRGKLNAKEYSVDEIVFILTEKIKKDKKNFEDHSKKMTIVNDGGSKEQVEVVVAFEFKDTKQEYIVYSKNERDKLGNTIIYVSKVKRDKEGSPELIGVEDETEWKKVKDILREMAKSDEDDSLQNISEIDGLEIL